MADKRSLTFDFDAPPPPRPNPPAKPDPPPVLTVGQLDRVIKRSLDDRFAQPVWAEGEVTGARPAPSGHLYFCLRDEQEEASIDVVMYRANITPRARALVADGARIRMRGKPDFWAPRGKLQFVADRVAPAGRGAILEAIEKLKAKLQAEGLFAAERKRPLPTEPRIIGVVTSSSGAAIHDICRVAYRRGGARLLLANATVQGAGAADSIRRAIFQLQRVPGVDVIIVGRGGGSTDDLAAFNEEAVVRAVVASKVPIVSAVGHEVDVSLCDFAADARAATPSQAAEMVVPDVRARRAALEQARARLARAMRARVTEGRAELSEILRALSDPRLYLAGKQQTLDERRARLRTQGGALVARREGELGKLRHRLAFQHPRAVVDRERAALTKASSRLDGCGRALVERRASALAAAAARLDALSPLAVLGRGYAIATRHDGRAVRKAGDIHAGDAMTVRVENARIETKVMDVEPVEEK